MSRVWLVREENHGVIGVAKSLYWVIEFLTKNDWVDNKDINLQLFEEKPQEWIEHLENEHGIFLENIELWG